MELHITISILAVTLLFVFFQDLKNRSIHIALPILIFALGLVMNYLSLDLSFKDILYNILFIAMNIVGLILYFSIKNKGYVNPIDKSLGMGDIAFFIAIVPLFNFRSFILFFIFGLVFSLMAHGIYSLFEKNVTIPLAGYLSLFLMLVLGAKHILKIDLAL